MLQVLILVCLVHRIEAALLDGKHFSCVMLIKKLHSLVSLKQLHHGVIVQITNYISQPLDSSKQVLIVWISLLLAYLS
jgi:hypothetical protein